MNRIGAGLAMAALWCWMPAEAQVCATGALRIPVSVYRDKMRAGWIGQMVGVAWGAPTEFKWQDRVIPEQSMPGWRKGAINDAFGQDDLYVEMTFLRTLEKYGLNCSIRQAGIDFANSRYALWCANSAGRTNLRAGIAPPDSGHPKYNKCPNDIDYQIEADYSGLIAPGLPQWPIRLGEKFGRLMNYGDGMYAGQFIGAMYSAAFVEPNVERVIRTALTAIPADCQYAEMVRDMLAWHAEAPSDWESCWVKCQAKYRGNPEYQRASNGGIDCKINGAYVLIGLLYGNGDPERTVTIACRGGMDSDCNPSSAAGVLFTMLGSQAIPSDYTVGLDETRKWDYTAYTFPALLDVCERLARRAVLASGGRMERDAAGAEVFVVPQRSPVPTALELSWAPGPVANSRFTRAEMARITVSRTPSAVQKAASIVAPGWQVTNCGPDMSPGLRSEWMGRKNVLLTHPLDHTTACVLRRAVTVRRGRRAVLRVTVGHHPGGDWALEVRVNGERRIREIVGAETCTNGWRTLDLDLTPWSGRRVVLELANQPTGWAWEGGYWAEVSLSPR